METAAAAPGVGIPTVRYLLNEAGFDTEVLQNAIIEEGFSEPTDFLLLEKSDIDDMTKRIASLPTGQGRVHIGQVRVKKLLGLVWWIKDQVRRGQEITPGEFNSNIFALSICTVPDR